MPAPKTTTRIVVSCGGRCAPARGPSDPLNGRKCARADGKDKASFTKRR
jgi:hypothetical protein